MLREDRLAVELRAGTHRAPRGAHRERGRLVEPVEEIVVGHAAELEDDELRGDLAPFEHLARLLWTMVGDRRFGMLCAYVAGCIAGLWVAT